MQFIVPPSVSQNIARAKSLLARGEAVRALSALLAAIELLESVQVVGRARSGTEIALHECVDACNHNPVIKKLIQGLARSDKAVIAYKPGEEKKLAGVLTLIRKALTEAEAAKEREAEDALRRQRENLFEEAQKCFRAKEAPKARALLRRLGDEFGSEPGVLASIGRMLMEADFLPDAVPYLEQAIADFPRDSGPYSELANVYLALREFAKAEKLYLAAIREFGAHPRTLTNLGKLYISWNKRDKAFDVLNQAMRLDPDNAETAELFAKVNR